MADTRLTPPLGSILDRIAAAWLRHRPLLLRAGTTLMAIVAAVWLAYQFWRLVGQPTPISIAELPLPEGEVEGVQPALRGAIDLAQRHEEVQAWFSGNRVYIELGTAVYPPASYAMLWPVLGWLGLTPARWLWATTAALALLVLARQCVRSSLASTSLERGFVALVPLSMYATGATVGNGQLLLHLMPLLLAALVRLQPREDSLRQDLWTAALFLVCLVKPSVTAPFFWLVVFLPGSLRPALLVGGAYLGLTLLAAAFQTADPVRLLEDWLYAARSGITWGTRRTGYANASSWLAGIGIESSLRLSLVILAAHGAWVFRHRRTGLWLVAGATAYVARFWTYHAWYDDLLLLLPMLALFRLAARESSTAVAVVAGAIFAATWLSLLAPGGLYLLPPLPKAIYLGAQQLSWLLGFAFLVFCAERERRRLAHAVASA